MKKRAKKALQKASNFEEAVEKLKNRSFKVKYAGDYTGTSTFKMYKEAGYGYSFNEKCRLKSDRVRFGKYSARITRYDNPANTHTPPSEKKEGVKVTINSSAGTPDKIIIAESIKQDEKSVFDEHMEEIKERVYKS